MQWATAKWPPCRPGSGSSVQPEASAAGAPKGPPCSLRCHQAGQTCPPDSSPGPPWHVRGQTGDGERPPWSRGPCTIHPELTTLCTDNDSIVQGPGGREAAGSRPPSLSLRPLLASADVICKHPQRQLLGEAATSSRRFQQPTRLFRPRQTIGPFLSPISYHFWRPRRPAPAHSLRSSRPGMGRGSGSLAGRLGPPRGRRTQPVDEKPRREGEKMRTAAPAHRRPQTQLSSTRTALRASDSKGVSAENGFTPRKGTGGPPAAPPSSSPPPPPTKKP